MATVIKRGPYQYQAKVRRNGYPLQSKTFERKQDALDWAATVRRDLMVIAAVFTVARDEWNLPIPPTILKSVFKRTTQDDARERRLTDNELTSLTSHANHYSPEAAACIHLVLETGMRRGEVAYLGWQNVNLNAGFIRLRAAQTKNNENRIVPLSHEAVNILHTLNPSSSGRVFKSFSRPDSITQLFSRICTRACIHDLRFHDLRHEAASRMAPHMETATLAKIMGWRDIQMAMRYYNPQPEELVAIVRNIQPRRS